MLIYRVTIGRWLAGAGGVVFFAASGSTKKTSSLTLLETLIATKPPISDPYKPGDDSILSPETEGEDESAQQEQEQEYASVVEDMFGRLKSLQAGRNAWAQEARAAMEGLQTNGKRSSGKGTKGAGVGGGGSGVIGALLARDVLRAVQVGAE